MCAHCFPLKFGLTPIFVWKSEGVSLKFWWFFFNSNFFPFRSQFQVFIRFISEGRATDFPALTVSIYRSVPSIIFFIPLNYRVAQSVERAAPGEEVPGSIPAVAARYLLVGSVSVLCDRLRQKSWSPSYVLCVAARKIARRSVLGPVRDKACFVDEEVKKPNKQTLNIFFIPLN